MPKPSAHASKELTRLRAEIDEAIETGEVSVFLLLYLYEQLLAGKINVGGLSQIAAEAVPVGMDVLQTPLLDLGLTVRARKALQRADATILGRVAQLSRDQLAELKNCGDTTVDEICGVVASRGLRPGIVLSPQVIEVIGRPKLPST